MKKAYMRPYVAETKLTLIIGVMSSNSNPPDNGNDPGEDSGSFAPNRKLYV